jgi:hypothetical protein
MKVVLFAAGFPCLMGVARASDDEQLVREVVKSFVTDYNNGDFKNAPYIQLMTGCISIREADLREDETKF